MSPARTKVLAVQLGHCYRTTGATGTKGEQGFATAVGQACMTVIDGVGGWQVRQLLADDHNPDHLFADAFVAIHADGSLNPAARGASVGYRNRAGQAFAQAWKRCYEARGWTGGFRDDNYTPALAGYYGVREAVEAGTAAAFIVEAGFLSNPGDNAILTGVGGAERVAWAIRDALGIREPDGGIPAAASDEGVNQMKFVRGNAGEPWGLFVFQIRYPEDGPALGVRRHIEDEMDPAFRLAKETGAGMDPRTSRPYIVDQSNLDKVLFESTEARDRFQAAAAKFLAAWNQAHPIGGTR